jgi:hypothetical protein
MAAAERLPSADEGLRVEIDSAPFHPVDGLWRLLGYAEMAKALGISYVEQA